MFPIYEDISRTKLIVDRRRYGTANLFGIIAYTDANPNIKRFLRDIDEWDSIDYISSGWIIYAIRPEYGQRIAYSGDKGIRNRPYGDFDFDYGFLQDFGIESSEQFPMFIVCALTADGRIESVRIPIDDSSQEVCTASLKATVEKVTRVIKEEEVPDKNPAQVLHEIERALKGRRARISLQKASRAFLAFFRDL